MEGSSSSSSLFYPDSTKKTSELADLQKELEEKESKIRDLKKQRDEMKQRLENKKKDVPQEKMEAFRVLTEKYVSLRDEYNALLANKSQGNKE